MDRNIFCPTCGYNLRGLPDGACPECGQPFEAAKLSAVLRRPRVTMSMIIVDLIMWPVLFWVLLVPFFLFLGLLLASLTVRWFDSLYPGVVVTAVAGFVLTFVITRTICIDLAQQTLELKRRRDPGGQYRTQAQYQALYAVIQVVVMVLPMPAVLAVLVF